MRAPWFDKLIPCPEKASLRGFQFAFRQFHVENAGPLRLLALVVEDHAHMWETESAEDHVRHRIQTRKGSPTKGSRRVWRE
jgi:hypothetical protein